MIDERIRAVFAQVFNCNAAELQRSSSPDDVEGWDSFGHLALVDALSHEFQITFEVEDIAQMDTLWHIEEVVRRRGARR